MCPQELVENVDVINKRIFFKERQINKRVISSVDIKSITAPLILIVYVILLLQTIASSQSLLKCNLEYY